MSVFNDEKYFYKLLDAAKDRVSPEGCVVYLIGTCMYSLILFGVALFVFRIDDIQLSNSIITLIVICTVLIAFNLIYVLISLLFEKFVYVTQKLATILSVIYTFFIAYVPLLTLYAFGLDRQLGKEYNVWLMTVLSEGILFFLVLFFLIRKERKNGILKKDGEGLWSVSDKYKKVWITIGIIILATYVWLVKIVGFFSDMFNVTAIFFFLIIALMIGVQEFILIAYCRIKFPSFTVTYEEATKYRSNKKKQKRRKKK